MANLTAKSPAGLAPITHGSVTLSEAPMGPIWALLPFRGKTDALSQALQTGHGLAFPARGRMTDAGGLRCAWAGMDQAFLMGADPVEALSDHAAVTDQSDAWTHLILEGDCVEDVLARLVPLDLSERGTPPGSAVRSAVGHMNALILRPAASRFEILVFRSMAGTALHDLTRAMRAIAARGADL